ncbi:MAG: oxygen-independent coproporphyrinogen III oxidase [Methyloligellaceae bacterium]
MATYLAKYALAAVPRYTSYPPATEFHTGVGESEYRVWLDAIGPDDTLSLYVHIPFCRSLCWYCGCHTTVPNSDERVLDYMDVLKLEIARVGECVSRSARVVQVHFGGGTPNLLTPEALTAIIETLMEHFSFRPDAEIAVEADPRCLSVDHIAALTRYANVRVSLGVQDVSPDVQKLINRIRPFDQVRAVVGQLRTAGVGGLNMDLMYGLPGQTPEHVAKSASMCAALEPDRFAVFGYAHVPWFKKHQNAIDETRLAGGQERLDQAEAARSSLIDFNYVPIGIDHFAKPGDPLSKAHKSGRLRRNFQGYTVDPANKLIGFGASSIGSFESGFVQNEPHIGRYREAVKRGELPVTRGIALSEADRCTSAVIERLMCDFEADLQRIADDMGCSVERFAPALSALEPLREDGLAEVEQHVVRATPKGRPYIRNIAVCFDAYQGKTEQRYSRVV